LFGELAFGSEEAGVGSGPFSCFCNFGSLDAAFVDVRFVPVPIDDLQESRPLGQWEDGAQTVSFFPHPLVS
jgi:hypothetical protein